MELLGDGFGILAICFSLTTSTPVSAVPSAPVDVSAAEISETVAQVTWSNVSGAVFYKIFRDGAFLGSSTTNGYTDSGALNKYRSYEYTVKACDANGESPSSEAAIFAYRRFPFTLPWDDCVTNVTDMSYLNASAADQFVTVSNGHLSCSGQPIRFLGVNMDWGANFPPSDHPVLGDVAEKLAARMAKLGVNCVRFTHMDARDASNGGIFNEDMCTLNTNQLAKLDYFIYRLKQHGIYADLNLQTGRIYPDLALGDLQEFKGIDLYYPDMIEMQKEYASNLLEHVNPYTGNSYADEPAVAFIEINNENGLIYKWRNGLFDSGSGVPSVYSDELKSQWNDWLCSEYSNSGEMESAWGLADGIDYGSELLTNGDFSAGMSPWTFQAMSPAAGTSQIVPDGGPEGECALEINVTDADPSGSVQVYQRNLEVTAGLPYTVRFKARSAVAQGMSVIMKQAHSPWAILDENQVTLSTNWQEYALVIEPSSSDTDARVDFGRLANGVAGKVWFADASCSTGNGLLGEQYAEGIWPGPEQLTNGDFSAGMSPWTFQVVSPAAGTSQIVSGGGPEGVDALEIDVTDADPSGSVQVYQRNLEVTAGLPYTVRFKARSAMAQGMSIIMKQAHSPWAILDENQITLSTNWQEYAVVIDPSSSDTDARVDFGRLANSVTGKVWFAEVSLKTGLEMLTNGNFSTGMSTWTFQAVSPASGTSQIVSGEGPGGVDALEVNVTDANSSGSIQVYQRNLEMIAGLPYTVNFKARAEFAHDMDIAIKQAHSPWFFLANSDVSLSTNWQQYTVVLVPSAADSDARIDIGGLAGGTTGKVWFAEVSLVPGAEVTGLQQGESYGDVEVVAREDFYDRTSGVRSDWLHFLFDTEVDYWNSMRSYIKNTLGAHGLVIGTQVQFTPSLTQSGMDAVDAHCYWEHPRLKSSPWYFQNVPMAGSSENDNFSMQAPARIVGKPMICTEYNHPSPNTYGAETYLLASAYAALQGWDAVFAFGYCSPDWNRQSLQFFDVGYSPVQLTSFPAAAAALRAGEIYASASYAQVTVTEDEAVSRFGEVSWPPFGGAYFGLDSMLALQQAVGIRSGTSSQLVMPVGGAGDDVIVAETGEMSWDMQQGVVTIESPKVKAVVGHTDEQFFDLGDGVVVVPGDTMQGDAWAAISLLLKEGSGFDVPGSRILVTANGYTDNHKMLWVNGMGPVDTVSSVEDWGESPVLLEGISAVISLPLSVSQIVGVWALDGSGERKESVPVYQAGGYATFDIDGDYQTAWYEVETVGN